MSISKTFSFVADRKAADARALASQKMTPEQRAASWAARLSRATSRDFINGKVF